MRRFVGLLAVAAVALLPGCGGSEGSGNPFELVSSAGATTLESGTAKLFLSTELTGPVRLEEPIEGEGVFDFERQRGELTMDMPEAVSDAGGMDEMHAMFDGERVFYSFGEGAGAEQLGVTTPWVSMDLARVSSEASGADIGALQASQSSDPTQALSMLRGTGEDVEELGEEEVRGESTTRYSATIDLRKAYEDADAVRDPAAFERFIEMAGPEIDMDVWIDDDGRARRTRYEQPMPQGGGTGAMVITMELYDFGTDADVQLPAADEVTDITDKVIELTRQAQAGQQPDQGAPEPQDS